MTGASEEHPTVPNGPAAPDAAIPTDRTPQPRPADAARQALRTAREQGSRDPEEAADRSTDEPPAPLPDRPPAAKDSAAQTPRPGDAARAALRRAVSTRRGEGEAEGAAEDVEPTDRTNARPADAARDALRAALRERAAASETESGTDPAGGSGWGARPDVSAAGSGLSAHFGVAAAGPGLGARFGMPAGGPEPGTHPDGSATGHPGTHPRRSAAGPGPGTHAGGSAADPGPDTRPGGSTTGPEPGTHLGVPAATPRLPRSMGSPHRDGELRRTFPAFPPRPSDDAPFAAAWWGNAWITALEKGALDVKRLARGRGYADRGHVDAITVTPGLVLAYVRGSRPRPYRVQVRLRTLDDAEWERFLDAAADRPAHIAALLDKEMPEALAEGDVPLLPGPGDLDPRCSCPDRGHPCKHAAALCYQTARLLDADPFVLLLLRGRGERELLDALSRRNAARAARAAQDREPSPLPGTRATDALTRRELPPLPPPLPLPPHPEQPPAYPAAPGGPDPFALDQLATDAAARAHALLTTGRDPVAELPLWQDAVRLAAARPGSGLTAGTRALYSSLASAAGRTPAELARAVAAWRQGGLDGLSVLEEPWDPPAGRFDRARPLLLAADLPAFRPWRNRLTHPHSHVQLRLGRDNLWYAYESEPGHDDWWPRGTPDPDPVGALMGLGA
ncbi:SWIM zinc finger family protein [Streptomyces sp. HC307]|uniref:SWIM zinc finger family protein n=1 Tax=Streptomyces flavusporus TaxID=3385496 RepID=UPI003916EDC8